MSWEDEALCAETGPDLFFPDEGEPNIAAKSICAACNVREQCLRFALDNNHDVGVWGGTSARQRLQMKRETRRVA